MNLKSLIFVQGLFLALPIVFAHEGGKNVHSKKHAHARHENLKNSIDASRFKEIQVDRETASFEIAFWTKQLSEHALFLYLMIEDDGANNVSTLKKEAKILHKRFESFIADFNRHSDSLKVMNKVLPLTKDLLDFKLRIQAKLTNGEWLGWIYPDFVDHVVHELNYFIDKLNGMPMSAEEEVDFWNHINGEHAGFTAHLLDPKALDLVEKAESFAREFKGIPQDEAEMFIRLSLKRSRELDKFQREAKRLGSKQVKSVIHPALLDHVIRENNRSIFMLERIAA